MTQFAYLATVPMLKKEWVTGCIKITRFRVQIYCCYYFTYGD